MQVFSCQYFLSCTGRAAGSGPNNILWRQFCTTSPLHTFLHTILSCVCSKLSSNVRRPYCNALNTILSTLLLEHNLFFWPIILRSVPKSFNEIFYFVKDIYLNKLNKLGLRVKSNFQAHGVIILVTVFISSSDHLDVLIFVVALESPALSSIYLLDHHWTHFKRILNPRFVPPQWT